MMITNLKDEDVVLAHDSFTQFGGAERFFEGVHKIFPTSPVVTLVVDEKFRQKFPNWKFITSPLQTLYAIYPKLTHYFAIIPLILNFWNPFKAKPKLILSTSSSYIKGLYKPSGTKHINYCHTPTRFLWVDPEFALREIPSLLRPIAKMFFAWQRKWDLAAAKKVDFFIANSKEIQRRLKKVYNRDSEVIYPFVDVDFWKPTQPKQDYFLIAGRLQYAKGLETVIAAFNELCWPLHVAGTGRFERELKTMAKSNVTFLGYVSDEELRQQYSGARGFIYPQLEDFGLMPLEAALCGTATIGLAKGGSLETIIPGKTGELLETITVETLIEALKNWKDTKYNQSELIAHAQQFSKPAFKDKISATISNYMQSHE